MSECYYKDKSKCDFCDFNFDFKCCDHKDDKFDCHKDKKDEKFACYIPIVCCKCQREKNPCKDRY
ncbi:MAG: hypothetical protein GX303_02030 [Clostridiales bacterium]|nr:hypothetical protein [Clostridiales bacterium]